MIIAEEVIRQEKYSKLKNLVLICDAMDEFAEKYHQDKLKLLGLHSVVFSEAEVCQLKKNEYIRGIEDGKVIAEHGTTNWQT